MQTFALEASSELGTSVTSKLPSRRKRGRPSIKDILPADQAITELDPKGVLDVLGPKNPDGVSEIDAGSKTPKRQRLHDAEVSPGQATVLEPNEVNANLQRMIG